ncbi:hypothetical protein LDENG_00180960 [Lucifuga dentata]|nr:hypothetical protein LDENG_00180960 [Lucifuga dentata]
MKTPHNAQRIPLKVQQPETVQSAKGRGPRSSECQNISRMKQGASTTTSGRWPPGETAK